LQPRVELGELALVRRRRRLGVRGGRQRRLRHLAVRLDPRFQQLFDQGLPGQPARPFQGCNFVLQLRAQPNLNMLTPRAHAGGELRIHTVNIHTHLLPSLAATLGLV
jgi:hypothetical protein